MNRAVNQPLLVSLSGEFEESDALALRGVVDILARSRRWTVGPPQFIDEVDSSSCTAPEDEPVRTVGAVLEVTSPHSLPGTSREEATAFIDGLAALSRERGLEMEVQLGNVYAGEIRAGVPDRLVREGLLATW